MSDLETLRDLFARGALLRPDPEQPNLVDLAQALAALEGDEAETLRPGAAALVEQIGAAEHLIFILADGLGLNLFDQLPDGAFLARHRAGELRTVFPSTTATALTTLATGAWPGQHGVTGQWTHLPRIDGAAALLPFAARSGGKPLRDLGVEVGEAFPVPALMARARRDTLALFPSLLVNGISSIYFSGDQPRRGYETLGEAAEVVGERVSRASAPTYTYLYTPRIDAEAHFLGVAHHGVQAVVGELNRAVERIATGIGARGRIVLTADHGMLNAPVSARHALKPSPTLFSMLNCTPSGDDRVLYLQLCPDAEPRLREWLHAQYGDAFLLLTIAEAEAEGLFGPGPIAPGVRDRFGDLVLISRGADVIEYVPSRQVGRRVDLNAYHSGLSPAEVRVPLVII